jgi:hypothetical protein
MLFWMLITESRNSVTQIAPIPNDTNQEPCNTKEGERGEGQGGGGGGQQWMKRWGQGGERRR